MKLMNKFIGLVIVLILLTQIAYSAKEPLLEFRLKITKDNLVSLENFKVYFGYIEKSSERKEDYKLIIYKKNQIEEFYFPVNFFILTIPNTETAVIYKNLFIPYSEGIRYIEVVYNDRVLETFQLQNLLCNNDGNCEGKENSITCQNDCQSFEKDNLCTPIEDGKCDPDCREGQDYECTGKISQFDIKNNTFKYSLSGLIVAISLYLIYRHLRKR